MRDWLLADTEPNSAASLSPAKGARRTDIPTTAEILQDAKDSLRTSTPSSVYTDARPVQMDPKDWHHALDAGFTASPRTSSARIQRSCRPFSVLRSAAKRKQWSRGP